MSGPHRDGSITPRHLRTNSVRHRTTSRSRDASCAFPVDLCGNGRASYGRRALPRTGQILLGDRYCDTAKATRHPCARAPVGSLGGLWSGVAAPVSSRSWGAVESYLAVVVAPLLAGEETLPPRPMGRSTARAIQAVEHRWRQPPLSPSPLAPCALQSLSLFRGV